MRISSTHVIALPIVARKALAVRITGKGRVTIAQGIRERVGFMPGTDVAFQLGAGGVCLVKADKLAGRRMRGQKLV
jgi:bifunctional DNA-binding transcriptional regulator/antitoxin component of YhaV-PrlF toxin-antitoxin module